MARPAVTEPALISRILEYLVKPVEKEQLIAAVENAAARRSLFSGNGSEMKP